MTSLRNHFKHYSDEEIQFIVDNYQIMTSTEIGKHLGRKASSIRNKVFSMSNSEQFRSKFHFTKEEEELLKTKYCNTDTQEIAMKLGRTPSQIREKAYTLGITKHPKSDHLKLDLSDNEIGFFAACIDCDGWISVRRTNGKYYHPEIGFTNTNKDLATWVKTKVGGGAMNMYQPKQYKKQYRWKMTRREFVKQTLPLIIDSLIAKKNNAIIIINWLDGKLSDEKAYTKYREVIK